MSTTYDVPQTMRAQVLPEPGKDLVFTNDRPVPQPSSLKPGQCLVKLQYSGVCHSDLSIKEEVFPVKPPKDCINGHEGIGHVVAIGEHTQNTRVKLGDRVGVSFVGYWCMDCEMCLKGAEQHCYSFKSCGHQLDGTFAEYVVAEINTIVNIPDNFDSAAAASIMCAGITVYRAIKHSGAQIGEWIAVPGAGGGLGHLAVQYAVAMGLRVVAIDTGEEKKNAVFELGAEKWVDFKESKSIAADVIAATDGRGAHAAIVAADNASAYEQAAYYLRSYGTLMTVGLPPAVLSVPILLITMKGLNIRGSMLGNRQEFREAISIAASGKVKVKYSIRGLSELPQIYEEMKQGKIVGRIVMDISK